MKKYGLAVLGTIAILTACSSNTTTSTTSGTATTGPKSPGAKTIGVSIQDLEAQFYQQMEAGMRVEATKFGYKVTFVDASRDSARQQSQVEDFISRKVDAIVLTPYDSQAIGSAIVEANNANIPVFTADIANASKQGKVISHVASNNVQGGEQAGMLMCKALNNTGTVAIIDEPEVTSVQDRVKGFRMALQQHCPNVKVVADVDSGGTRTKANADTGDVLQRFKNLSGIFGINDDSALGAVAAIAASGAKGIAVVGYDASPEARAAIKSGTMVGDAIQHPDVIGKDTIDVIHDYFSGKKVPARIDVPVGTYTKANAK
ncbi:MAG TPA: substrate-binding domain-containing protein [Candidatus Rubrimentiphilum sp.]|nr:substrate-binding domain-containing protein [Candidatus Rubrimentiphilum sp.]